MNDRSAPNSRHVQRGHLDANGWLAPMRTTGEMGESRKARIHFNNQAFARSFVKDIQGSESLAEA